MKTFVLEAMHTAPKNILSLPHPQEKSCSWLGPDGQWGCLERKLMTIESLLPKAALRLVAEETWSRQRASDGDELAALFW